MRRRWLTRPPMRKCTAMQEVRPASHIIHFIPSSLIYVVSTGQYVRSLQIFHFIHYVQFITNLTFHILVQGYVHHVYCIRS